MTDKKGTHNVFVTMGASNHSKSEREENDYYATPPIATKALLNMMRKYNILQVPLKDNWTRTHCTDISRRWI